MTPARVVWLCYRAAALLVASAAIAMYFSAIGFAPSWPKMGGTLLWLANYLVTLVGGLLIAAGLWRATGWLTHKTVRGLPAGNGNDTMEVTEFLDIGLALIGIYAVVSALPDVIESCHALYSSASSDEFSARRDPATFGGMAGAVGRFVAGLWLVFGGRGIVDGLTRFRTADMADEGSAQDES
jgi:hypothetical protein